MFELPELQFELNALEPYIDSKTMQIHHDLHHGGYVNKLNIAVEASSNLQEKTIEELLSNLNDIDESIRTAIRNNGGGHYNHSLFWEILTPSSISKSEEEIKLGDQLLDAINQSFGSFDEFKSKFEEVAVARFGSGWAWLVKKSDGSLEVTSTPNQDNPLIDGSGTPILGLDVWEHAYYLNYQNRRPDYIKAFWNIVNWEEVSSKFLR